MELSTMDYTEVVRLYGSDTFDVPAGQKLIIETSPGGAEVLETTVPAGKTWNVGITVHIQETTV